LGDTTKREEEENHHHLIRNSKFECGCETCDVSTHIYMNPTENVHQLTWGDTTKREEEEKSSSHQKPKI
jgi:hypothetical protein